MTPKRIQRKRTKGWRMPEGAVYVGRPTRWGNPWTIRGDAERVASLHRYAIEKQEVFLWPWEYGNMPSHAEIRAELAGKDLVCWCSESQPCHADVLLEIANKEDDQ